MSESFDYIRRSTVEVNVGDTPLGGGNPVRIQSMATASTMDVDACVSQAVRLVDAGAEYVRFTAQGVREAESLGRIRAALRERGVDTPLVADIHFNPAAAFASAEAVEKVRINPGNFVDPGRTFRKLEYTDDEYQAQLQRIEQQLVPFLEKCRVNGTAIRIGVNHGSLSDRIMSRYGDTPAGMAESAMEFLRVCCRHGFKDVVISVKASNVVVMVETVRRLVRAMDAEDMHFPLHLGVTEAGDAEDGRIKSAVGIGTLLNEGVGDTIRVSLSEDPVNELPVARELVDYITSRGDAPTIEAGRAPGMDEPVRRRRESERIGNIGGDALPVVAAFATESGDYGEPAPDLIVGDNSDVLRITAEEMLGRKEPLPADAVVLMTTRHPNFTGMMQAAFHAMMLRDWRNPVIIQASYTDVTAEQALIRAAADCGTLLMNGFGDGLLVDAPGVLTPRESVRLAFGILQSTRLRMSRTEYISCPGCGRTLFDLQTTLARVKEATSSLKGLKIGVMGCIVNGPGEMADADYGYVGAGVGRVSLYRGKECVQKNIPVEHAVDKLVELIKADGHWN